MSTTIINYVNQLLFLNRGFFPKIGPAKTKYSRSDRAQSKLLKCARENDQTLLTSFFEVEFIRNIEVIISDNEEAFTKLMPNLAHNTTGSNSEEPSKSKGISYFLNSLLAASEANENKASKGRRYDNTLKRFSCVLYLLSGRMAYEILYANLQSSLPSITTIKTMLDKETNDFKMGIIRVQELKKWLTSRSLRLSICVAEDLTKIIESVQYNSKENSLDGLSPPLGCNGFPKIGQFPAKNAIDIISGLEFGVVAPYMNVFMAKAQGCIKQPGFCLSVYPTDNRFDYKPCLNRWDFLTDLCATEGDLYEIHLYEIHYLLIF